MRSFCDHPMLFASIRYSCRPLDLEIPRNFQGFRVCLRTEPRAQGTNTYAPQREPSRIVEVPSSAVPGIAWVDIRLESSSEFSRDSGGSDPGSRSPIGVP